MRQYPNNFKNLRLNQNYQQIKSNTIFAFEDKIYKYNNDLQIITMIYILLYFLSEKF